MKHLKTFENYDTKPELIVRLDVDNHYQNDENPKGEFYSINKQELEGKMYHFFREDNEVDNGDNEYEIVIRYSYEAFGGNNPEDIKNANDYLHTLPGVESVVHRMGHCFEVTFDKPIEFTNLVKINPK